VTACDACLRRTWLVARVAGHIEHARHERRRLHDILALDDETLVAAVGGRHAVGIGQEYAEVRPGHLRAAVAAAGLDAVCRHDERYPSRLRCDAGAPAVLHVAGTPGRLAELVGDGGDEEDAPPAVAVVGARRATADGAEVARALGRGLAAAGITVVSGMALGIDAAAHAGALEVSGPTLAVMGGSADVAYPGAKRWIHRELVTRHCVVSEMPPGFRPYKWSFPARNRIIAALARVTVVVEAAERSGSLITADFAAQLGREVAAVPGRVTAAQSRGTNALIRDGAALVRDARDVLDLLFGASRGAPPPDPTAGLEPRLRELLAQVEAGRDTVGALGRTPEEAHRAAVGLTELELLGFLRRDPGGRYGRVPA
jgi:DNA processing protein